MVVFLQDLSAALLVTTPQHQGRTSRLRIFLPPLTGGSKALSLMSGIKDSADHAGHLPPQPPCLPMARSTTCPMTWSPSPPSTLPAVPPTLCTVEVLGAAWAPSSLWPSPSPPCLA